MNGSERELTDLLRDGDWLRRFVSTLVKPQDVDDIVQSAWLAALQSTAITRNVRHWLKGAAGNLARLLHRKRARGDRALRRVEPPASEPSAADLVAALEVQRLVSDALLALPEPTRTILVLRYQQRLPMAAIAAKVDLQEAAVRQRLHRGREAVRDRLAQRFGDDWRGCVALGAFVHGTAEPAPIATGLALAGGAVAAAGLTVVLLAASPGLDHAPPSPIEAVTAGAPRGGPSGSAVPASSSPVGADRTAVVPIAQEPQAADVPAITIRGRAVAAEDSRPLAGVRVTTHADFPSSIPAAEREATLPLVTGADGAFVIRGPARASRLDVWLHADGRSPRRYEADPVQPSALGDIELPLGFEVRGQLLDETGSPASAVRLAIAVPCGFPDQRRIRFSCTTDARGEFAWQERIPAGTFTVDIENAALELRDGTVEVRAGENANVFVLHSLRLPAITGVAFASDGTPCADLEIPAFDGPPNPEQGVFDTQVGSCRTGADGSFALYRQRGESAEVDLRSSTFMPELELFEPLPAVRWGTPGMRVKVRPHAEVELRVVDVERRAPIERFVATWTFARGTRRVSAGGNQPATRPGGIERLGRLAHGTRILVWSDDPTQAQVEVVVTDTMLGKTTIEVALPRLHPFPCAFVDRLGRPIVGTFHVLDRNGTPAPQAWSDPRGGTVRVGTEWDLYRLHSITTDRDGKGTLQAPCDGRELVVVRDGTEVRPWIPLRLPGPGEPVRIVVPD